MLLQRTVAQVKQVETQDEPQEFKPTVETMDALNQALQSLVDTDGVEFDYIELPKTILVSISYLTKKLVN